MFFLCKLIKDIAKQYKITLISLLIFCAFSFILADYALAKSVSSVITDVCEEYGLSEKLVYSVIKTESNFNEKAVSNCDARGLMQITRPTWEWMTKDYLSVDWDYDSCCFDPEKNIIVGTRFLKWIVDYLDARQELLNAPKQDLVLACYNSGPGNVRKYNYSVPPFNETQNYVRKINMLSKSPADSLISSLNKS